MQRVGNWVMIPFLAVLLVVGHAFLLPEALAADTDCPEGISGYWRLDETTAGSYADAIGGNIGTCEGNACPGSEDPAVAAAGLSFDGNDAITMSADLAAFNWSAGQSFTIELWMRRTTGTINGEEAFVGRRDADTNLNWYIGVDTASGNAVASLNASDGSGPYALTVSKDLRSGDNTWHHVALVRNASANNAVLYVDGEASAPQTIPSTSDFVSDTAPLTLGAVDGSNFFRGALDEVAVYGRALTADEIKGHYYVSRGYCSRYDSPVTIMPLGDSITAGIWIRPPDPGIDLPPLETRVGYRYDLWQSLGSNLYQFEYVGSEEAGSGVDPNFNPFHAGFLGYRDDQINTLLAGGYLTSNPAEIILLHIGTNGVTEPGGQSADDVSNILDEVDNFSKNVTVVLARIIDLAPNSEDVSTFNTNIANMASARIAQGDKIILVDMADMEDPLNYTTNTGTIVPNPGGDMYDRFHPNPSGYNKIAGKWFETLETILPQSELPEITSTAITVAAKDAPYTYTVTATGPPSPTFEFTNNPAPGEMTINADSGLIEWTPDTLGDYDVTVRASNWTGEDVQSFTISVNDLPQAAADAYADILEGQTLTVSAAEGVLTNDTSGSGSLTAVLANDVRFGTLNLNADGSFTYTHDGTENFNDSFSYRASNGAGESDAVVVTLTITPVDDPITPSSGGGGGGGGCFITALH